MSKKPDEPDEPPSTKDPEERIRELKARAAELTGGEIHSWSSGDAPPEVLEQFWENVVAYEETPGAMPMDVLQKGGLELPPPDELDDAALPGKLRDLVQAMALRNMYVYHTDHLSDRELYDRLWSESLREEMVMPMGDHGPRGNWMIDLIGSGSDEDIYLDLKYYADEEHRRHWAEDFPEDEIPEHEDPPYDRDRTLPQPDWGLPESWENEDGEPWEDEDEDA